MAAQENAFIGWELAGCAWYQSAPSTGIHFGVQPTLNGGSRGSSKLLLVRSNAARVAEQNAVISGDFPVYMLYSEYGVLSRYLSAFLRYTTGSRQNNPGIQE